MPFVTNPVFADGNILTASQLNILSANLEYLFGRLPALNPPFNSHLYTSNGLIEGSAIWWFRYTHRYMHYKFSVDSGSFSNDLRLEINGNFTVIANTPTGPLTFEASVDMNGYALVLGTWYFVRFTGNKSSGSSLAHWLFQSPVVA